ncbi:MAG: hypothetical protein ABSA96_13285 [Candidatus Acidiferrales bacterium]
MKLGITGCMGVVCRSAVHALPIPPPPKSGAAPAEGVVVGKNILETMATQ